MDQIAELCMSFCLFYAICCEIYDVLIYALYPESFCVENVDGYGYGYMAFSDSHLQKKRFWSESGDKKIHEAANH